MTWCNIMASRDLLSLECRWRIGTCNSMSFLNSPWLPRPHTFKLWTLSDIIYNDVFLDILIDSTIGFRRQHLVKAAFSDEKASLILGIPLSFSVIEDRIIWHYSKHSVFEVK